MSQSIDASKTVLILGIGNVAMGDEGFGVHVVRQLKNFIFPDNVSIQEGAVAGFDLLGSLTDVDILIIVDVMITDLEPGEIAFMDLDNRFNAANKTNFSFHQVGIVELLQISGLISKTPQVHFLVTKPEKLEWSFELSSNVQKAAEKAVLFLTDKLTGDIQVK
ncbi:MAG: hydrogenase maturation protease [Dehalococcoidia bacterium]|nr:MAG: hydrogenase maturation protease [Dehalococcoidia bacterium]